MTDPLPPELEFVSVSGSSHTTDESYDSGTHTVTFTFQNILTAGSTGSVQIQVRFPNGTTPDGTVATNQATLSATNASSATSSPVIATATALDRLDFEKGYVGGGAAGSTLSYYFYGMQ